MRPAIYLCHSQTGEGSMKVEIRWIRQFACVLTLTAGLPALAAPPAANAPTAEQALKLTPIQKDIEYDRPAPAEAAKCTIKSEKIGKETGWVVRDANGTILREFVDSNGDNVVDRWSYYRDGVEVYRDIDSDFNGKADAYRWMNTAGTRWGVDKKEDGTIDGWRVISAEEVTSEIVEALRTKDVQRFQRLLMTSSELKNAGIGTDRTKNIAEKLAKATSAFESLLRTQKTITANSKWIHFAAPRPGLVPAGTDSSANDLIVYENVVAMVDNDGKAAQVVVGTLVKLGEAWRAIDAPNVGSDGNDVASAGVFFAGSQRKLDKPEVVAGGPSETLQTALVDLEKIDAQLMKSTNARDKNALNEKRADLIEKIVDESAEKDKAQWVRQMADSISAAVQAGDFTTGMTRLKKLEASLATSEDKELLAYVKFRALTADYAQAVQSPGADYAKIQTAWLEGLEGFVKEFPKSVDTAEALLQLAVAYEFAGQEEKAKKWYDSILSNFPNTPYAKRASGSLIRLNSVGRPINLKAKTVNGQNFDLAQFKGKVVLIQYWATWCEPAKADMAQLKELQAKYAKEGFVVVGVNLDTEPKLLADFLQKNKLPWAQLFEPGGLDSRLAFELGIHTLPTNILIDAKGNVHHRGIHVSELDAELKTLFK